MKNGKYRVAIGFKGKRYHLGTYGTYTEAVDARLQAEEAIHDGFVKAYYSWKEKEEVSPGWGDNHPLVFEVDKKENGFEIRTIE